MIIINPGNPTGQVFSYENLQEIIDICYKESILIMTDEVYEYNIYKEGKKFHSVRKVLADMGSPYKENVEVISFNSVSKGLLAESGLRGGYMELTNIDKYAIDSLYKVKSIELCSNTIGQVALLLLIDHPKQGVESQSTVDLYNRELQAVLDNYKKRSKLLSDSLNSMRNITCTEIEGGMNGFPRLHLSQKALDEAKRQNITPETFYCEELLKATGIVTVPGSGFGQQPGTHHLRITNLYQPIEKLEKALQNFKAFNERFQEKY